MRTNSPHITIAPVDENEPLLLQQLAEGGEAAFAALFKSYQPRLYRFLYPFSYPEEIEEIIQDIFLKVWEKRESLIVIRSFEQYLYRMAKNRLMDLRKSDKARLRREMISAGDEAIDDYGPVQHTEYKELYEYAVKVINELTPRQQLIYRMSVFEDKSLDEISATLDLSKAVTIKQLYIANRFIRAKLNNARASGVPLSIILLFALSQAASQKIF